MSAAVGAQLNRSTRNFTSKVTDTDTAASTLFFALALRAHPYSNPAKVQRPLQFISKTRSLNVLKQTQGKVERGEGRKGEENQKRAAVRGEKKVTCIKETAKIHMNTVKPLREGL